MEIWKKSVSSHKMALMETAPLMTHCKNVTVLWFLLLEETGENGENTDLGWATSILSHADTNTESVVASKTLTCAIQISC